MNPPVFGPCIVCSPVFRPFCGHTLLIIELLEEELEGGGGGERVGGGEFVF